MPKFNVNTRVTTDKNGYDFIAKLYHDISSTPQDTHIIDFTSCAYFESNLLSALGAILDKLKETGHKFNLRVSRKSAIFKAMARNGFLKFWISEGTNFEKENFIKYEKFSTDNSDEFKQYIDEWLIKKQKFPRHSELAGEKIQESIYEIYANAVEHGKTNFVYACGEYKQESAVLDMTIVDCGKTIPLNVNEHMHKFNRPALEPCKAVEWAFIRGNTTKNAAGGLGLAILKEFVSMNQGCLQMVSDNVVLEYKTDKMESYLLDKPFPGTIVNVKFNFNDDKNYYMLSERVNIKDLL